MVLVVKNPAASIGDERDAGLIVGSRRSPGEGNGNPLQNSCLENPMDRGAWQATVHRVTKSWAQLKQLRIYTSTHIPNGKCGNPLSIQNISRLTLNYY